MPGKGRPGKVAQVALAAALAASAVPADAFASGSDGDGVNRALGIDGGVAQGVQSSDGASRGWAADDFRSSGPGGADGLGFAAQGPAQVATPLARSVSESAEVTDGDNSYRWTLYTDGGFVVEPLSGSPSGQVYLAWNNIPWLQASLKSRIRSIEFSGRLRLAGYTYGMFQGMRNLVSVDLSGLDTSSVADMGNMFYGCSSLRSVQLSGLDTSSVKDMSSMFQGCESVASVDLLGLDTSSVKDTSSMFEGCSSLASVDFSGLDVSDVTNMSSMFYGCSSLASLDLSGLDTSSVTNMRYMFHGCSYLSSVDFSGLDVSGVTDMAGVFYGCSSLQSVDLSGLDTSRVTNMSSMFDGCSSLAFVDLSGLDTSSAMDMFSMFRGCRSLRSVDLSGLDTSRVTGMGSMFDGCSSLVSLDLSGFDTSSVTDMSSIFDSCTSLASVDLSGLDTSRVTDMGSMFYGCSSLTSLDLSGFDVSRVAVMSSMFSGCDLLSSVMLGGGWRFAAGSELPSPNSGAAYTGLWVSEGSHRGPYSSGDLAQAYNADPSGMAGEWTWERRQGAPEADLSRAWVSGVEATYVETGSPVDVRPVVTLGGKALSEGSDYDLSYRDSSGKAIPAPTAPGSYKVVVTGKGAYWGEKEVPFEVVEQDGLVIPLGDAFLSADPYIYWGDPVKPRVSATYQGKALAEGGDYRVKSVSYDLATGTGQVVLEGLGRFSGEVEVSFSVTVPKSLRFADVSANDWYFGSVAYARANGIVSGYAGTDLFGPDDRMTRAQAAAILQRVLDPAYDPSSSGAEPNRTGMPDVEGGSWYSAAANWAVANGVISGVEEPGGGRTFRPDEPVTREQLCAIVRNAAERFGGAQGSDDPSRLDSMPDAWQVSGWARDSVAWGVNQGVITGVDEGGARYARPLDPVTRAQMAAVMMNSIQGGVLKR